MSITNAESRICLYNKMRRKKNADLWPHTKSKGIGTCVFSCPRIRAVIAIRRTVTCGSDRLPNMMVAFENCAFVCMEKMTEQKMLIEIIFSYRFF